MAVVRGMRACDWLGSESRGQNLQSEEGGVVSSERGVLVSICMQLTEVQRRLLQPHGYL